MKSIAYHDPDDLLRTKTLVFELSESRPNASARSSMIKINIPNEITQISRKVDGIETSYDRHGDQLKIGLNGRTKLTDQEIMDHRLTPERAASMLSYYRYLWHLPITLLDPGTILHPQVIQKNFYGLDCYELRVTYDAAIGGDIWYFYFDKGTYALRGYRFYHDEGKNDGEYILLEGESSYKSLRLPLKRKWYMNADDKFLGEDILLKLRK